MIDQITKLYEGADLSGATANVLYVPVLKTGILRGLDILTDLAQSGAGVFSLSKNGAPISGLTAVTIPSSSKSVSITGLSLAVTKGDEIILSLVSGNVSAPVTLNLAIEAQQNITQAEGYDAAKAIILPGANITVTPDDTAHTLTIAGTGGGGGSGYFQTKYATLAGLVNVTETATGRLQKTAGTGGSWDAGAYSSEQAASGYFKVEATVESTAELKMLGVSNATDAAASAGYLNIDFGLLTNSDAILYQSVNGSVGTLSVAYAARDRLGVEITAAGVVNYLLNGKIIAQLLGQALNYPLCADFSFEASNSALADIIITTIAP